MQTSDRLSAHALVAEANLLGAYRRHIDTALSMSSSDFWAATYRATATA